MRLSRRSESRIRRLRSEFEALLFGKRELRTRPVFTRKIGAGNHSRFETLEQRVVLSATIGRIIGFGYLIAIAATAEYISLLGCVLADIAKPTFSTGQFDSRAARPRSSIQSAHQR